MEVCCRMSSSHLKAGLVIGHWSRGHEARVTTPHLLFSVGTFLDQFPSATVTEQQTEGFVLLVYSVEASINQAHLAPCISESF